MSGWCDLPGDLIGEILRRLPSFADRARLPLVCRRWRAAWRAQPHPVVPWHTTPGFVVTPDDGGGVDGRARVPLPADARGAVCRGAIGSWLALAPPPPDAPFLINAFSLDRVPLPIWRRGGAIRKVVMSSAPDSRAATCVVAGLADRARGMVAVCRPTEEGPPKPAWTYVTVAFDVEDIAFHGGELYLLHASNQLCRVAVHERGAALRVEQCPVTLKPACAFMRGDEQASNLVDLDGELVMAWRGVYPRSRSALLFVLRHDDDGGGGRCWSAGVRLDGRFLVVGNACCGAFGAAAGGAGGTGNEVTFFVWTRKFCLVSFRLLRLVIN